MNINHYSTTNTADNPFLKANFLSKLTFCFVTDIVKKFLKKEVREEDLYQTLPELSSEKLGKRLEQLWMKYQYRNTSLSILRMLFRIFGKRLLLIYFVYISLSIIRTILEPYLVATIFANFTLHRNEKIFKNSLAAAIGLYFFYIVFNFIIQYCIFLTNELSLRISVGLSSLIYRKLLRLKSSCILNGSFGEGGNVVTLITKDVFMFRSVINAFAGCLCFVLSFIFSIYLVFLKVGMIGLSCFGVMFLTLLFEGILGKIMHSRRIKVDLDTARRIQVIREALSAIKTIKMLTWEEHFIRKINAARNKEIKGIFVLYVQKFFIWFLGIINISAPFYIFLILYIHAFQAVSIVNLLYVMVVIKGLRPYLMDLLPTGIAGLSEMLAAIRRIHKFLILDEVSYKSHNDTDSPRILLNNVNLEVESFRLNSISLNIEHNGLVFVTGILGSGKSMLLKSILGEIPLNGHCEINGRLSYASQEPWIFPSTIQENIIFGEDFDEKRYAEVLSICDLLYDLQNFDKNDETLLTDGGANLSKGQQVRINLARAIYKKADIYLLDDCLSALDEEVSLKILNGCAQLLGESIVLMVIQNPTHLKCALPNMRILLVEDGKVSFVKNHLEKLLTTPVICDNKTVELKQKTDQIINNLNTEFDSNETAPLLKRIPKQNIYYESIQSGSISKKTFKNYINFFGGIYVFIFIIFLFCIFEVSSILSQKFIMFWITAEGQILNFKLNKNTSNYIQEPEFNEQLSERNKYFLAYNTTFFLYIFFGILATILHFFVSSKASIQIHQLMVQKIMRAESKFFDTNLLGNIINRFSKDIYNLDENIPFFFFQVLMFGMEVFGTLVLIAISNWILLILVIVICLISFAVMKYIFLPITSSLKRLESAVHSPMVGHLSSSLEGLVTIRVHEKELLLIKEFDVYQDKFSSAYFINLAAVTSFCLTADVLLFLLLFILLCYFYLGKNITAAEVGVILATYGRLFGNIKKLIPQLIELLSIMTSAERVFDYTKIKTESQDGIEINNWPESGNIEFNKVSLTYPTNVHQVLKEINLEIKAGTKIGIIGRTGSGKSSLVNALFRLYASEGRILIDQVEIKHVALNYRSKIGIVSQTPIIFSGTVRDNLDPGHEFADDNLWNALNTIKLWVNLYDDISSLNLSTGQKQLICVARVLLAKKKIVILDEVTTDLDMETESYICELISEAFKDCTVLIITHKSKILYHVDKIISVKDGCVKISR